MENDKPNPCGGGNSNGLDWAFEEEELAVAKASVSVGEPQSFPILKEDSKTMEKKKGTAKSLSDFTTGTYFGPGGASHPHHPEPRSLTTDELLTLPTGPHERTVEEIKQGRLDGGFGNFPYRVPCRADEDSSWGSGSGAEARCPVGFDEELRRNPISKVGICSW